MEIPEYLKQVGVLLSEIIEVFILDHPYSWAIILCITAIAFCLFRLFKKFDFVKKFCLAIFRFVVALSLIGFHVSIFALFSGQRECFLVASMMLVISIVVLRFLTNIRDRPRVEPSEPSVCAEDF